MKQILLYLLNLTQMNIRVDILKTNLVIIEICKPEIDFEMDVYC